ncbi:MAG: 4Fe-4S binding protein [Candidatus Thorarchaeota archaeon]
MGVRRRVMVGMMNRFGMPRIREMVRRDQSTSELPGAILSDESSPERFVIPLEMLRLISSREDLSMSLAIPLRRMMSLLRNERYAVDSIAENPPDPSTEITEDALRELETFAKSLGVLSVGYARLPPNLIFRGMGILYTNAIVLTMEMDREKIDMAPSSQTADMIMKTYDELGITTNRIADHLRSKGYGAQASHPLGGLVLYPPLAQDAGLGWIGHHGLLITPEAGPRVRLAAVFTSIENLPFLEENEHRWIEDYCQNCGICVRGCPPRAILDRPLIDGQRVTHIDLDKCFPYFVQYDACTICVKICPFSRRAYAEIHETFERKR